MSKINHRRYPIDGQFVPYEIEMLRSPAFRELSGAEYQILFCIESELARHGGKDNGNLIVTYDACVAYGVRRNSIAPGIRVVVALGFLERTEQGYGGNAEFRRASKYRLTYRPTDDAPPTHEWRRIAGDDAAMIAKAARRARPSPAPKNRKPVTKPILKPVTKTPLKPSNENDTAQRRKRYRKPSNENAAISRYLPIYEEAQASAPEPTPSQPPNPADPPTDPTAVSANGQQSLKLPWATPHLIEITDPEELRRIREALLTDGDLTYG
jgi:hypothetical protein